MYGSAAFWIGIAETFYVRTISPQYSRGPMLSSRVNLSFMTKVVPLTCLLLTLVACSTQKSAPTRVLEQDITPQASAANDRAHLQNSFDVSDPAGSLGGLASGQTKPPTPEELQPQLESATHKWFYGPGVGRTALNIGTIVLFPPYALYLLGNAGLNMAGFPQIHVTDALPPEPRDAVNGVYDDVTSAPGRLNAFIAGEEFQDPQTKIAPQSKTTEAK